MSTTSRTPMEELKDMVISSKEGAIVLCASTRAASLAKRKLISELPGKAIMNVDVISSTEFIAKLTREIGIESQVIGGLGREMVINEIMAGIKSKGSFKGVDLTDYVRTTSKAISELIGAGVEPHEIQRISKSNEKMVILHRVFSEYIKRIRNSKTIDAKELPGKLVGILKAGSIPRWISGRKMISFCVPKNTVHDVIVEGLESTGVHVYEITPQSDRERKFQEVKSIYARQGRQLSREVARNCKMTIVSSDCSFKDICIVVPSLQGSEREVVKALEWAGIPSMEPLWMDLAEHPVAASIISAMRLITASEGKIDIFPYCSSPYYGMDSYKRGSTLKTGQKENLSGASRAYKIQAMQWKRSQPLTLDTWSDVRKWNLYFKEIDDTDREMETIRTDFYGWAKEMRKHCTEFSKPATLDVHCANLTGFIEDYYVKLPLLNSEDEHPYWAALERKAIDAVLDVVRKVRAAYLLTSGGANPVEWREFAATIEQAFMEKRLMLRGSSRDGVGVAEPKDILGIDFKHIFVYEASEKNYPRAYDPGWLLTEKDRENITSLKGLTAAVHNAESKSDFFSAIKSATSTLTFAIPSIGVDEREVNRSIWVADVEEEALKDRIQVVTYHSKRRYPAPDKAARCVTNAEASINVADRKLQILGGEESSLLEIMYMNRSDDRISGLSSSKFDSAYEWSASGIAQYLKCGLAFVPQYLCGIRQPEEYEDLPMPLSSGEFLHDVAKEVVDLIMSVRGLEFERAKEKLLDFIKAKFRYGSSDISRNSSEEHWSLMKVQYERIMVKFAEDELRYLTSSGERFKKIETEQHCSTSNGDGRLIVGSTEIAFNSHIDRIDMDDEGNAVVYDYKSGKDPDREVDVQVDFYTLIIDQAKNMLPIGSAYFPLSKPPKCIRSAISTGSYIQEYRDDLELKVPSSRTVSLVAFPKADAADRRKKAGERIESVIRDIRSGKFFEGSPYKDSACRFCLRRNICWQPESKNRSWGW